MSKALTLILGLSVLATTAGFPVPALAGDKTKDANGHHHKAFLKCAEACNACQRECDACAAHCAHLIAHGKKEHLTTLRTCQDCAVFCATAAQIVARKGPFSELICKSCAEACARCGKACEAFPDEPMMKRCAEECRRCEKACREMLKHVGHQATSGKAASVDKK